MDKMEKVRKAAKKFSKAVADAFGEFSFSSLTAYASGQLVVDAVLFANEEGVDTEYQKRKTLYHQWFTDGEWEEEDSELSNEYHKKNGLLLEKEVKSA